MNIWRRIFGSPPSSAEPAPKPAVDVELPRDTSTFPILDAEQLLRITKTTQHARLIGQLSGLPTEAIEQLVDPLLRKFAESVQLCPASQAHHHAGPGGMLVHGFEVAEFALRRRKGYLLPQGGRPEDIQRDEHVWSYAVLVGALLHDIGKPIVDLQITVQFADGRRERWNPLGPPINAIGAAFYEIDFCRDRQYGLHTRVATLMFGIIVPEIGRNWLAQNRTVITQLSAWLVGETFRAGNIGEIAGLADSDSVAANLRLPPVRLPTVRDIPLIDRLMQGLRYILASGRDLPLNRDGAAGFVTQDGHIWLLVPRTLEVLRGFFVTIGYGGMPAQNERVYDTWQEHGAVLVVNDRAVCRIRVAGAGFEHRFTAVRMPLHALYAPRHYPQPFGGDISLVDDAEILDEPPNDELPNAAESVVQPVGTSSPSIPPAPLAPVARAVPTLPGEGLDALLAQLENGAPPLPSNTDSPNLRHIGTLPRTLAPPAPPSMTSPPDATARVNDGAARFLAWLEIRLKAQSLAINCADAPVHVVDDGQLLLVSPRLFQIYAESDEKSAWSAAQKDLVKSKVLAIRKGDRDGGAYWRFDILKADGTPKGPFLGGLLLADPKRCLNLDILPPANPRLRRQTVRLLGAN